MRRSVFRAPRHGERLGHEFTRHVSGRYRPTDTSRRKQEVTMVVRRDEAIRGTAIPQKGRRPRRIAEERMCSADDCSTKLSVYNRTDVCWIHEEPHPFVLDGVRKRRDEPVEPSSGPLRVA
jgi:hypothetical protein